MKQPLKIRFSRTIPKAAKVTTVTVSRDPAGRYFVSMLCDDAVAALPKAGAAVGLDLGLSHFAVFSTGEKVAALNFSPQREKAGETAEALAKKKKAHTPIRQGEERPAMRRSPTPADSAQALDQTIRENQRSF